MIGKKVEKQQEPDRARASCLLRDEDSSEPVASPGFASARIPLATGQSKTVRGKGNQGGGDSDILGKQWHCLEPAF